MQGVADRQFNSYMAMVRKPSDSRSAAAKVAQGAIYGAIYFLIAICGHRRVWDFLQQLSDVVMAAEQKWPKPKRPQL